jgi:hypothetical protein
LPPQVFLPAKQALRAQNRLRKPKNLAKKNKKGEAG